MLLSLSWLREFVPYNGTAEKLGEKLTMLGLELEGIERPFEGIKDIVVGHVQECGPHPESDHLSVCRVDVGDEVLDIVCGAPNVAAGQKVPVARVGCTLPGGLVIKKAKLRGIPSHGMICSERELGFSDEHAGIMVLDTDAVPGTRLVDALNLDQEVLDISITPNRGDCLSVLGLAREVALAFNLPLTLPPADLAEAPTLASELVRVDRVDGSLAPLYYGRVLTDAKVGPSPAHIRYRLHACGIRPISNVVDMTNYILLELGQPLHAFDLDKVAEASIIVRGTEQGEKTTTLDGQERTLEQGDIAICDPHKIVGLGGVMGGLNSEIEDTSTRIFLEGAAFAPGHIRRTARRLGLHSEASFRFERGIDQSRTPYALDRAASLMARYAGATVLSGYVGVESHPVIPSPVPFCIERAEKLLGIELSVKFCHSTFEMLDCLVDIIDSADTSGKAQEWLVTPPAARTDIFREADLIEELARVYGVDKIPAAIPAVARNLSRAGLPQSKFSFLSGIRHWAVGVGLNETINYSFVAEKALDLFGIASEDRIMLQNPLSEDLNVLRPELAPGIMGAVCASLSKGAAGVRFFEVAHVFMSSIISETTAQESARLALVVTGARHDRLWPNSKGDQDYQDIKGIVEHLMHHQQLAGVKYVLDDSGPAYLQPCVAIRHNKKCIGFMGRLTSDIAAEYNAKKEVWYAEIDLEILYKKSQHQLRRFAPLAVYPPVRRDITFIAAKTVRADEIIEAIHSIKCPILENIALIDSFEPKGKDEKNLTYRLTFRSATRTLKETEADKQRDTIAAKLPSLLQVRV